MKQLIKNLIILFSETVHIQMSSYQFSFFFFLKNQVEKKQQDYLHKYIYSLRKGDYLQGVELKGSLHNFTAVHMHIAHKPICATELCRIVCACENHTSPHTNEQ